MTREEAVELANRYMSDNGIPVIELVEIRSSDVKGLRALNQVLKELGHEEDTVLTDYWVVEYLIRHRGFDGSEWVNVPADYVVGVTKTSKSVFPIVLHESATRKRFPLDD